MYHRKRKLIEAVKDPTTKFLLTYLDNKYVHKFTFTNKNIDLFKDISKLKNNGKYYVDEIIMDDVKRKPYLDLEKVYDSKETFDKNYEPIIKKLQKDIIKVFKSEYNKTITIIDILILDSSGKVDTGYKISLHIIISPKEQTYYYTNSKFTDSSAYHLYTSLINMDSSYKELLDPQVYNTDVNFRIIGSSKKQNDNRILKPIGPKTFIELELTPKQKLNYMLTYIDPSKPSTKLKTPVIEQFIKAKQRVVTNRPSKTGCNEKILELAKKYHPTALYNGYYEGYYNFNYTNRKESCPISGKLHSGTNGFYCYETPCGLYLGCFSDSCKGRKHLGYIEESDNFIDDAIQINQQYLMEYPEMENIIDDWITTDKFTLAVKSRMGTGKTTMIKHILEDYEFKKILWITHRQTLTKSTYGSFNKYGFVNYLDVDGCLFKYNKVIVQVDSLMRITDFDEFEGRMQFKKYDLVIIDEIEGCLSHFNSPFLNRHDSTARDLFDFIIRIINHSNKLLLLDADIGVRTKLLVEYFGYVTIVNNSFMPMEKQFDITNYTDLFHKSLYTDVESKKNVCVVSMSSNAVEMISTELGKMGVKYVLHTSKTDDKLKNELENVNDFWTKYQVVLYSPTIESGIDFNAEHFDKIYCVISDGNLTCSQRAFLQMVGRIRKIRNSKILCLYQKIPMTDKKEPITDAEIYTFDDLLGYFKHYETLNGKKILRDVTYQEIEKDDVVELEIKHTDITLFDKISLHNEAEQLNKHHDIFTTVLTKLINKSGHKIYFSLSDTKKKKDENDDEIEKMTSKDIMIEKLMSVDEKKFDIQILEKKQAKSDLNETEKLVLKKYFFRKTWGIDKEISDDEMREYLKNFLDKEVFMYRGELTFGYKKLADFDNDTFSDGKEKVRGTVIVDFVNRLTGKKFTRLKVEDINDIKINNDQYTKAIKDIANNSIYFKNEEKYRSLFFKKKGKLKTDAKNFQVKCANTVQALLDSYNIHLRIANRKRKKGKRIYEYSLAVDKQIMKMIDGKYNKKDN
jgi:superfamily II DNA or RNA helicase